jgi:hypothetical protein
MRGRRHGGVLAVAAVACGLGVSAEREARGHFLFVRIGPMAEAGRSAEVYFSEQAEAGDPRFIAKVAAGTRLWLQTRPGEFRPLPTHAAADRLRATVPAGGSLAVVGVCEYGVLGRPNQTPFLLRYYPKAVAGKPDELNALKRLEGAPAGGEGGPGVGLEIVPTFEPGRVRLAVYRGGAAVPGAVFHTVDSDLTNSEVTAGPDGWAAWSPPAPGRYSVYVKDVVKQGGSHNGTRYDEVREFATLAFNWPIDRRDADPEAVALFESALATRASWNAFPGFSATAEGSLDGRPFSGKVTVGADGAVKAEVDDPAARPWLEDQLGSIALHRLPDDDRGPSPDRPKPVLRFADGDEEHPLGRLLTFQGGRFASSYRVKDGQIAVVNRHMGKQNLTITVLENAPNPEGKFLPRSYLVQYWDAASGALDRVESVQERWSRVKAWDLPTLHTVTTSSGSGVSVRSVTLSEHEMLPAK